MSVILVNTPLFWGTHRRVSYFERARKAYDPGDIGDFAGEHLGLASIKAYCEREGIPVHTVNGMIEEHTSAEATFADIKATAATAGAPVLIGFSGTALVFSATLKIAELCRQAWPAVKIILGYDFGTLNYEHLLQNFPIIDYVCQGEGERVVAQLAERLLNGRSTEGIAGLAWRNASGKVEALAPDPMDVNTLPWASRVELPQVLKRGFAAGVFTSRGCPYRCSYCGTGATSDLFSGKDGYRLKSVENVAEEIAYLKRDFGIGFVGVLDDLFVTNSPSSHERAERFANELIRLKVNIRWMTDVRVDSVDLALFKHLNRSGLTKVYMGVETGSREQLESYNKKYVLRNSLKKESPQGVINKLKDVGVRVCPGIIMFHPMVTPEELRSTLNLVDEAHWDSNQILFNRIRAYPGTPLYKQYQALGLLTEGEWPMQNWKFVNPRAKEMADAVLWTAVRPSTTYADVRKEFVRHLEAWEKSLELAGPATPAPAASDEAMRTKIDRIIENAGSS